MLLLMLLLIYTTLSIASITIILIMMMNAPFGWEDKDGFHIGKRNPASYNEKQNSIENFLKISLYAYSPK